MITIKTRDGVQTLSTEAARRIIERAIEVANAWDGKEAEAIIAPLYDELNKYRVVK